MYSNLHVCMIMLHFHTQQYSDPITMQLEPNNTHIIYCHIDATQPVGLAQTYFTYPDYLVIQGWIWTADLYPDTINQTGPFVYHYVKFFPGIGLHTPGHPMWLHHGYSQPVWCCMIFHCYSLSSFINCFC